MKTLKFAVHIENNVKRADLTLASDGNYFINITQYDKEGYYLPQKSFTVVEYHSLDCALGFWRELLANNKLKEIAL